MPSITVENYLKTLYDAQQRGGAGGAGELVSMGTLASAMSVAPGTATAMVKALAESGLVDYEPRGPWGCGRDRDRRENDSKRACFLSHQNQ